MTLFFTRVFDAFFGEIETLTEAPVIMVLVFLRVCRSTGSLLSVLWPRSSTLLLFESITRMILSKDSLLFSPAVFFSRRPVADTAETPDGSACRGS